MTVGSRVRVNESGYLGWGTILYMDRIEDRADRNYVIITRDDGGGNKPCYDIPVKYWNVEKSNILEIINPKDTTMSNLLTHLKQLGLSADDKLMMEMGLEDPSGVPTPEGWEAMKFMLYTEHRAKLVEHARALKAEQDAKAKK